MKKRIAALSVAAVMALGLASCGDAPAAEIDTAAGDEEIVVIEAEEATTEETTAQTMRQDGELHDEVIMIEAMEETVHYEHIVNRTIGFEMDYDYERFLRQSDGDRECFISVWDDPPNPENYLELSYSPESAETTAAAIIEELSQDYEITQETQELEYVGEVTWIEASVIKGTNNMADQIQASSAAVNLDMMFIDEGFGSLDDHARGQAVRVLLDMAGGSKLVGIISHVTELRQEIDEQLSVTKDEFGSHAAWV